MGKEKKAEENKASEGEKKKSPFEGEEKLGQAVEKINKEFVEEMKGRPYLLLVTSGFEVKKEKEHSSFAPQWSWRSNIYVGSEEGKKLIEFLISQLKDAVEDPKYGIKKQYGMEKGKN